MPFHQPPAHGHSASSHSHVKGSVAATLQPPTFKSTAAEPPKKVAWPVGKISTNKDESMIRFLEKKRERGESLTEAQLALIDRFHAPEHASLAKEVAKGADSPSAVASSSSLSGTKRARDADVDDAKLHKPKAMTLGDKLGMSLDELAEVRRKQEASKGAKKEGHAAQTGDSKKKQQQKRNFNSKKGGAGFAGKKAKR